MPQDINKIKEEMIGYQYKHYKGNTYTVMDIGIHTETQELMVVYRNINDEQIWCRPLSIFNEEIDNEHYKRFAKIDDDRDLKNQQEQAIFKELEEKGYKITEKIAFGQAFVIEKGYSLDVIVYKTKREYKTRLGEISIELHQLLHRLFEIWGWFDEK